MGVWGWREREREEGGAEGERDRRKEGREKGEISVLFQTWINFEGVLAIVTS